MALADLLIPLLCLALILNGLGTVSLVKVYKAIAEAEGDPAAERGTGVPVGRILFGQVPESAAKARLETRLFMAAGVIALLGAFAAGLAG